MSATSSDVVLLIGIVELVVMGLYHKGPTDPSMSEWMRKVKKIVNCGLPIINESFHEWELSIDESSIKTPSFVFDQI